MTEDEVAKEPLVDSLKRFYSVETLEDIVYLQHKQILKLQADIKKSGWWGDTPKRTMRNA